MKKTILFLMAMFVLASSIATAAPKKKVDALDATIREASDYLNLNIPKGNKAVFLNVSSIYPDLSEYMLAMLSENAVNDMVFSVVDRAQLDAIRAELNFQFSGEVDDGSAQEIGKMLGAQMIVSGAISKVGTLQRLQVKAIEVQTASVRGQWSANLNKSTMLTALTKNQSKAAPSPASTPAATRTQPAAATAAPAAAPAAASSRAAPAPATAAPAPATQPAQPTGPVIAYKIGDTGPAGGIIFYDKGNNTGGWRYLEAAPADLDRLLVATTDDIKYNDLLERGIGWGKRNTAATMIQAAAVGGGFGWAAQAADGYTLNGFNDWFLPSRDELGFLYGHLHMQGLGNFRNERYWSSTHGNGIRCWSVNFSNGEHSEPWRDGKYRVRPIRQFADGQTTPLSQTQSSAPGEYKIGDKGPAGGLVFYDKGNNTGGWRYLEAAPADIDRLLVATTDNIKYNDLLERGIGWGKRNTEATMVQAATAGGGFGWATQAADAFVVNGFDDWFLPSRDELSYMYGHLQMQGLGSFKNEQYWSSTHSNGIRCWSVNFNSGEHGEPWRDGKYRVRPIRQF